jgi:hypothetical protein
MRMPTAQLALLASLWIASMACAADLQVQLPAGTTARRAAALAPSPEPGTEGTPVNGTVDGQTISFTNLESATAYDLRIDLKGGQILHGVNMAWYTSEPPQADAGPLDDDDRRQIGALVSDVKSFYDTSRIVTLTGDHNRATVLVERIRSSAFHSGAAGEVIWRIELWYFTNEFGGWAELPQTDKVLIRSRFPSPQEYHATVDPLRWVPQLGGIILDKDNSHLRVDLAPDALPATQP